MASRTHPSVLFLELNEAERYWIDKLAAEGKLPVFRRLLDDGVCLTTSIPEFDPATDRAWRTITPWIIWPSVYTGMTAARARHHRLRTGHDARSRGGACGTCSTGRASRPACSAACFPSRRAMRGSARYYVPESLADDPDCFPAEARPVQEFSVFTSRNYSENFARQYVEATRLLLGSMRSGVRPAP